MNKTVNLTRSRIAAVFAVFLCMILCTGMLTEAAFADQKEALSFSFDRNKVEAGDTVKGTLDANYADITNGMITITYDKDLELIRAEKSAGQADDTYVSINAKTTGKVVIAFSAMKPVKQGALVDLEFKASSSAKGGSTLKISGGTPEIYDSANNAVKITALGQTIQVAGDSGNNGSGSDQNNGGQNGSGSSADQNHSQKSDQNSKTGDNQPIWLYIAIGAAALAGIAYAVRKEAVKKHESK